MESLFILKYINFIWKYITTLLEKNSYSSFWKIAIHKEWLFQ